MNSLPKVGSKVRITGHLAENGRVLTGKVATIESVNVERKWVSLRLEGTVQPAVSIRNVEPVP